MAQVTWMTSLLTTVPQDGPLLNTKFSVPRVKPGITSRERLLRSLDGVLGVRLALLSAPPGFGKTTLLADWVSRVSEKAEVAWLSLDDADNDPTRFWSYCFAALERVFGNVRASTMQHLSSEHRMPIEAMLSALINALTQVSGDLVLVLDDYHAITLPGIHQAVMFLVEHLPQSVHLLMACRAEPPFPLSRLRARGDLLEIRPNELRFTREESADFLKMTMGLTLPSADTDLLADHTEGWVAGLQLAGLSLRQSRSTGDLIASISGNSRYIADYLADEVFHWQPREVQSFLLATSILEQLSAPLCDHVIGTTRGDLTLEMIEKANLFVEPLDEERIWYKYHHLFREFLQARLQRTGDIDVTALHRRASEWLSQNGFIREAISHSFKASDFEQAAALVESLARGMFMRAEVPTLIAWLDRLPEAIVLLRSELCLTRLWCLLTTNHIDQVEALISRYETHWGIDSSHLLDDGQERASASAENLFKVELSAIKATVLLVRGDIDRVIDLSRKALSRLPRGHLLLRGILNRSLGVALGLKGDKNLSDKALAEAHSISEATGNDLVEMSVLESMAQLYSLRGELSRASAIYRQVLASNPESLPATGFAHVRLGRILYHQDRLDEAMAHLEKGAVKCKQFGSSDTSALAHVMLSRIAAAKGDLARARAEFQAAEELIQDYRTRRATSWIRMERTRLHLCEGNIAAAQLWAGTVTLGESVDEVREFEYIMLAQVRLAQEQSREAIGLLDHIMPAALSAGRTIRLMEIYILRARCKKAMSNTQGALSDIASALSLGASENIIRLFVDEGTAAAGLIEDLLRSGIGNYLAAEQSTRVATFAATVLRAFGQSLLPSSLTKPTTQERPASHTVAQPVTTAAIPLAEPLSERENEVLKLVASGLSNKEIADHMVIALTTVKWHVKNVLGKLGARSRTQAIAKAREHGLL